MERFVLALRICQLQVTVALWPFPRIFFILGSSENAGKTTRGVLQICSVCVDGRGGVQSPPLTCHKPKQGMAKPGVSGQGSATIPQAAQGHVAVRRHIESSHMGGGGDGA